MRRKKQADKEKKASCGQMKRLSRDPAAIRESICERLHYDAGRNVTEASAREMYRSVACTLRRYLAEGMLETEQRYRAGNAKRVHYLSMEFLVGRSLENNLINLGLRDAFQEALKGLGVSLTDLMHLEEDAALGNGGLGRLAACFLDSMATLGIPGYGYGINYEFGLFQQEIRGGYQVERPDHWMAEGTSWLIERQEEALIIPVYGRVVHEKDRNGNYNPMWLEWRMLVGVPHDMPVVGYGGETVNYLRLYSARASSEFDMEIFNEGDYVKAVRQKIDSENVSKVLYPSDSFAAGKELRLIQEYFFVACAIRDILRRFRETNKDLDQFPEFAVIQLNDTHPALAVAELMRMLVDEEDLGWERAWGITCRSFAYTNHTLLQEALEKWPVDMLERVLPRHLQIIFEINSRFLDLVSRRWPGDEERLRRMSLIEEIPMRQVRMANLSIVGSRSVNGVSRLHTELVKEILIPDFHALTPSKITNKTNGITQRRWLLASNPGLADLISGKIGDGWITDHTVLAGLGPAAEKAGFRKQFRKVKQANKELLAGIMEDLCHEKVDPESMFDVQAKRIHEYKRQLLNLLHVIHRFLVIREDGVMPEVPRTFIFAGKAAPGYWAAKQLIKLVHSVGKVVNGDPVARKWMRVVFIPDYKVSLAERIIPAADLSEQISTAGKEASGTGNMKFALNGALTMGTLDGANIEIREAVGEENIFIFGHDAAGISRLRAERSYSPLALYNGDPLIRRVMDTFLHDTFAKGDPGRFKWIFDALLYQGDPYFHLADFKDYIAVQEQADLLYADRDAWSRKAILNVARIGFFSSDRTIREYAEDIWQVPVAKPGTGLLQEDA